MSKKDLKQYLKSLKKKQLEDQVLDLYERFKEVKTYYNFVFDPQEEKLLDEAKAKILKEYFPKNNRKPKARRSVAQKLIKHYLKLGVEPRVALELMIYNIELAQNFSAQKKPKNTAFYKSILKSFEQLISFASQNQLVFENRSRILAIVTKTENQEWENASQFEDILDLLQ